MMKRILSSRGSEVASPKQVFRKAVQEKLIADPEIWFDFILKRYLTVHTYNLEVSEEIFASLPKFLEELSAFINQIMVK